MLGATSVSELFTILVIAVVPLVVAYRLGYKKGYRRAWRHATAQRGDPSDYRAYRER